MPYPKLILLIFLGFSCHLFSFETVMQNNSKLNKVSVEDFFRKSLIDDIKISPKGDIIVYENHGAIMVGNSDIPFSEISPRAYEKSIVDITWVADNVFIVEKKRKGRSSFFIFEIQKTEMNDKFTVVRKQSMYKEGYIVDPLLDDTEHILFAKYEYKNNKIHTNVFKVALFEDKIKSLRKRTRKNKYNDEILYWLTDKNHKLSIGISYENEIPVLWHAKGRRKKLTRIWSPNKKVKFIPYKLTKDNKLWVLTDLNNDKLFAAQFDLKKHIVDKIFFQRTDVDLTSIVLGENENHPLAVTFFEKGKYRYKFLDLFSKQNYETLQNKFSDQNIQIIDVSEDRSQQLVIFTSDNKAGHISNCTVVSFSCKKIGSLFPWLDDINLSKTESFTIKTKDKLIIESFITIPNNPESESIPIIIMPHGGPIGVRDNSYFSGDVQWLAYNGFAVLQVNYRGSDGYGNKFESRGLKQWGRAIEDDIEESFNHVLSSYPLLDSQRVCLYGASYGGYSAIMGIIRSPQKYRCAISFAGVTDLALLFNRSSVRNNHVLNRKLKQIIGNPEMEMQTLMTYSPVYQYKKITKPLMLIHGNDDKVVDVEHGWRLRNLLQLKNIPHEWLFMKNVGHGFTTTDQIKLMYDKIMPFLDKNLSSN